jgi:Domain of unknown function (DUF3291)
VWRLQSEEGNATALRPYGDDTLINLSVWKDVASLNAFIYKNPEHVAYMKRRREWFTQMKKRTWCFGGCRKTTGPPRRKPSRLGALHAHGSTPKAFAFKQAFDAPDAKLPGNPFAFGDICPA